jgi:hypothetical protein
MAKFLDALSGAAVEHGAGWENLQIFEWLLIERFC